MTPVARKTKAWQGLAVVAIAGWAGMGAGCGGGAPPVRPLSADSFVRPRSAAEQGTPIDRPGQIMYDNLRVASLLPDEHPKQEPVQQISPVVQQAVNSDELTPTTNPTARTTTAPAAGARNAPAANPPGFLTIGAVMMEVNGRPIFADKILAELEIPLSTEAKKLSPEAFAAKAKDLLEGKIGSAVREELEFAAAQRSGGPQDEAQARGVTTMWRQRTIVEAGGSLELAKRKAEASGYTFDELTERQYRLLMSQLYYQRHVLPLIQVSAEDIRGYYLAHKDDEFTTHGAAQFRVIKFDVNAAKYVGGKSEALEKAKEIRKRAVGGEDFAALAAEANDDEMLKQSRGYILNGGWVEENAYNDAEVNGALEKMRPGQISDVIQSGRYYFVVKLEDVRKGGVKPFDDLAVQDLIFNGLRAKQFTALRAKAVQKMVSEAVTRRNDAAINEAYQAILGRYAQWQGRDKAAGTFPQPPSAAAAR